MTHLMAPGGPSRTTCRPGSLDRPLRCAPLTVRRTAARTAPVGRSRDPGQMGRYQRSLVLASMPQVATHLPAAGRDLPAGRHADPML